MTHRNVGVTILMAMFNGATHLTAQLNSFLAQTHSKWNLIVSDDGSSDSGPDIIREFTTRHDDHPVSFIDGPQRGFAQNFIHLIEAAGPYTSFVALSDQDDVWLPHKLARGVAALHDTPRETPTLYCARTHIVTSDLTPLGLSPRWRKPFGFANALVQNIAAGNTIMLNRAALDLAQSALPRDVSAHDWWLYQLVSGAGGTIIWDDSPALLYRQHPGNLMGRNDSLSAWMTRFQQIAKGDFRHWNDLNIKALGQAQHLLTGENRSLLRDFSALRSSGIAGRLVGLHHAGLYRQTLPASLVLWLAALCNRL